MSTNVLQRLTQNVFNLSFRDAVLIDVWQARRRIDVVKDPHVAILACIGLGVHVCPEMNYGHVVVKRAIKREVCD